MLDDTLAEANFDKAERARIAHRPHQAQKHYHQAIGQTSDPVFRSRIRHMLGFAYQMSHDFDQAITQYHQALKLSPSEAQRQAIKRDLAYSLGMSGDSRRAFELLDQAEVHFKKISNLPELGATIGFRGRLERAIAAPDSDLAKDGLNHLREADRILNKSQNQEYELYNLLHLYDAAREEIDVTPHEMGFLHRRIEILFVDNIGGSAHRRRHRLQRLGLSPKTISNITTGITRLQDLRPATTAKLPKWGWI